jgi:lysophospholipase
MMQDAPYFADIADGPDGGRAFWLKTSDGLRLRLACWPAALGTQTKGTVLLFPGRTEYVEKYGPAAAELAQRGYGTVAMDWRGQGLADRPLRDRMVGHVQDFAQYQTDVAAMMDHIAALNLPKPYFLIGHSMGGCIGLRALMKGLDVRAAAFSAPMWGIKFSPGVQPVARMLSKAARMTRQGQRYAPGTGPVTYVLSSAFEGNVLTRDRETYAWMQEQLAAHPALALGGPGLQWLDEAIDECTRLAALPSPDLPCLCFLGDAEKIVDPAPIYTRMAQWPNGTLRVIPEAEHEIMMEVGPTRTTFFDEVTALFDAQL